MKGLNFAWFLKGEEPSTCSAANTNTLPISWPYNMKNGPSSNSYSKLIVSIRTRNKGLNHHQLRLVKVSAYARARVPKGK